MAPLPSNNTACLFVDYSVGGEDHTMLVRIGAGSTVADAMLALSDFLTTLVATIFTITITGARQRAVDAIVTTPVTWIGDATYGTGTATHAQSAWYINFVGRSPQGRKVRLAVFGAVNIVDLAENDYRLPATGAVEDAIAVLQAADTVIVAIDGNGPIWYPYANLGVNAYWRNRIR